MKHEKTNAIHERRRGRILIVDDDVDFTLSLVDILESRGYQVKTAHSAQDAQEKARHFDAQVALLDVRLKYANGINLIAPLKKIRPKILCVTMTAYAAMDTAIEALHEGAYDYLQKPLNMKYLLATLGRCFEKLQLESEKEIVEHTLRQRNRELSLLNQVSQKLTATLDMEQVAKLSLQEITETIGAQAASIWLLNEENELICQAALPANQHSTMNKLVLRPGQGIAGWVVQREESIIVTTVADDPRFFSGFDEQTGFQTDSLIAVPLQVRDAVIGVLEVVNKLDGDFSTNDLALINTLAAASAIALDNARLVESLQDYTAQLQARNEELNAYAHTVAHDLKGPLGPIVGFAQVLAEDYATMPGQEVRRYLHAIARNGRKIGSIIDELLLMAGLRNVEMVEMRQLNNMPGIVNEALDRLSGMIEKHQAEIILPDAWPAALGYGPWVEEVWVNYLSNAIKYGGEPEQGIPPRIEVGFDELADSKTRQPENSCIRFWVRDNGSGLTAEEQTRLFAPFAQLDHARAGGHGLGLSIAQRIVDKMNGQVGVKSEVGTGSTFWFTLPSERDGD